MIADLYCIVLLGSDRFTMFVKLDNIFKKLLQQQR